VTPVRPGDWIRSDDLTIDDVPDVQASWRDVVEFALTFDGYNYAGDISKLSRLVRRVRKDYAENSSLKRSLDDLRACLFLEQRAARWNEYEPKSDDLRYVRALLAGIAERLKGR